MGQLLELVLNTLRFVTEAYRYLFFFEKSMSTAFSCRRREMNNMYRRVHVFEWNVAKPYSTKTYLYLSMCCLYSVSSVGSRMKAITVRI